MFDYSTVHLTILDENDMVPYFKEESFDVSLFENLGVGEPVFQMQVRKDALDIVYKRSQLAK